MGSQRNLLNNAANRMNFNQAEGAHHCILTLLPLTVPWPQERYGLTELKKAANRMNFNQAEDEFHDGEDTIGLGVINKEGSGRLRAVGGVRVWVGVRSMPLDCEPGEG